MKNLLYIFTMILFISCASQYEAAREDKKHTPIVTQTKEVESDSVEYELIIFDPGFESWFVTRDMRSSARSNSYYKYWNQWYVLEWNQLFRSGHPLMENQIDYHTDEDYGFEVNYKLYHYFLYVENKYGITLIKRR